MMYSNTKNGRKAALLDAEWFDSSALSHEETARSLRAQAERNRAWVKEKESEDSTVDG